MIVYTYDGSFEGLLTCIYFFFYENIKPSNIVKDENFQENFLTKKKYIYSDNEKWQKVYNAIESKISSESLRKIYYVFLSELEDSEILIVNYIRLGFKIGKDVELNLANEHVLNIDKVSKRVSRERHRIIGLLRFKNIKDNLLYGKIEPDYNVIELTAEHFKARLGSENFIIHDTRRELAIFYDGKDLALRELKTLKYSSLEEDEEIYEELWKVYFKAISIKGKKNEKLQKSHMPKRYWKFLVEKN